MFGSIVLENPLTNDDKLSKLVSNNESEMYAVLEFNDSIHDIMVSKYVNEYHAMMESANGGDIEALNEFMARDVTDKMRAILQAILSYLGEAAAAIANLLTDKSTEYVKNKKKYNFEYRYNKTDEREFYNKALRTNPDIKLDEFKEIVLDNFSAVEGSYISSKQYWYPSDKQINFDAPVRAVEVIEEKIDAILHGNKADADIKILEDAIDTMTARAAEGFAVTVPKNKISNNKEFRKYMKEFVTTEVQTVPFTKWQKDARSIEFDTSFSTKATADIKKKLRTYQTTLVEKINKVEPEYRNTLFTLVGYIRTVCSLWCQFIRFIASAKCSHMHSRLMEYEKMKARLYSTERMKAAAPESLKEATIHGEEFDGDTLFANGDERDFNRTEWLDLALENAIYSIKYEMMDHYRKMALCEAHTLADENAKFRNIVVMREANENAFSNFIANIIKFIKENFNKFMTALKEKCDKDTAYINRNKKYADMPFNEGANAASTGDILAGMYRVQDKVNIPDFNYAVMKDSLNDENAFFRKYVLPQLNKSSNYSKKPNLQFTEGMTIEQYCKAYYGAGVYTEDADKCKFDTNDLNQNRPNMLKFIREAHQIMNPMKQELNDLERKIKADTRKWSKTATTTVQTTESNDQPSDTATAQPANKTATPQNASAFFSVYDGSWITEAEFDAGKVPENANRTKAVSEEANAYKVYLTVYKKVLMARITGCEFVRKEISSLIRGHIKSKMSPDERKADAAAENGQQNANVTATQTTTTATQTQETK